VQLDEHCFLCPFHSVQLILGSMGVI
jgi:hypothetical protein